MGRRAASGLPGGSGSRWRRRLGRFKAPPAVTRAPPPPAEHPAGRHGGGGPGGPRLSSALPSAASARPRCPGARSCAAAPARGAAPGAGNGPCPSAPPGTHPAAPGGGGGSASVPGIPRGSGRRCRCGGGEGRREGMAQAVPPVPCRGAPAVLPQRAGSRPAGHQRRGSAGAAQVVRCEAGCKASPQPPVASCLRGIVASFSIGIGFSLRFSADQGNLGLGGCPGTGSGFAT